MLRTSLAVAGLVVWFTLPAWTQEKQSDGNGRSSAEGKSPDKTDSKAADDKSSLAALQDFIGVWKGVGQPRRGSTKGAWTEQADWAWKFDKGRAAIAFESPLGKFFKSGELRPGEKTGEFILIGTLPDGETRERYIGALNDEGRLVLQAQQPAEGRPSQISFRQVAEGARMLILFEQAVPGSETLARLAEVGYTRQGSGFGQGTTGPECVVTGGYGSIAVQHNGKTYYVCCTGCRDLFNDDPEAVLADYRERKAKEKEARK
jgi:hypothetical protein